MILSDLLDVLRREILHDSSDAVSGDSDQLWSDTTLIRNIDLAQRRFARRSLCIRDGTSPVTQFVTVPYQRDYILDPSVVSTYSIRSMGNGLYINGAYTPGAYSTATPPVFVPSGLPPIAPDRADLIRTSHADRRQGWRVQDDLPFDVNDLSTLGPGKPLCYETDETMAESNGSAGVVTVRLYPTPSPQNAGCVMQLRVARLPLARLTGQNLTAVPEIPEDYHMDILDYAAYLALRVVDHEAGDAERAQEFQQAFDRHVEEARTEIQRKTFVPMRIAFGGSGMSYTGN